MVQMVSTSPKKVRLTHRHRETDWNKRHRKCDRVELCKLECEEEEMHWGVVRLEAVIATNIFTYAHAATWWRSLDCLVGTDRYLLESIMTKKREKKRRKKHVESTESPVNWIEQISCFRILRLLLMFLLHFALHASHTSVFVCVNLASSCLNFNSWWLELMCGVWPVWVCMYMWWRWWWYPI